MKKIIYIVAILFLFIFLISCSNDLSRSQAKKILQNHAQPITRNLNYKYTIPGWVDNYTGQENYYNITQIKETEDYLNKLKDAGYISYSNEKQYATAWTASSRQLCLDYSVTITDKLKPFIIGGNEDYVNFAIASETIDEVTGITKSGDSVRYVEFTTKIIPNPLSEIMPLNDDERTPHRQTAMFQLYDDGWRFVGMIGGS